LAILEGLRRIAGVRSIVADNCADNVGRHFASAFRLSPPVADEEAYTHIIAKDDVEIVVPATDIDLVILARERTRLQEIGALVAVSDSKLLAALMDKRATYWLAVDAGVPVLDDLQIDVRLPVTQPIIVKPLRGFGGKGQYVLQAGEIPLAVAATIDPATHLFQPYIKGAPEYSVDFAIDFEGHISPLIIRQRIRNFSGFSILGRAASDRTDILAAAEALAHYLSRNGGRGGFNVQFLDHNGKPHLIDINARFGTSSSFALEMGVNLQASMLGLPQVEQRRNVGLVRYITQTQVPADPVSVQGIVFDLDDTLIDQKLWISDKLKILHSRYGNALPNRAEFLTAAYQILEEGNRSRLIDELIVRLALPADMRERLIVAYREIVPQRISIYPDVARVMAELRSRGYRICLLSDNPAASQRQKLERLAEVLTGAAALADVVLTDAIGTKKPEAAAFAAAARSIGVAPGNLAMVGDNFFRDAIGAVRAGYAYAFLVKREGAFFNFNRVLADEVPGSDRVRWLDNLDQLLWHLSVPVLREERVVASGN
jgi:HAD superfamily hydrolase (TIGR01549 family)